jgi:hypothetical protein
MAPARWRRLDWRLARRLSWRVAVTICCAPLATRAAFIDADFPNGLPTDPALRGPEVLPRSRPEYDPLGVRVGDFVIRPQLEQSLGYDGNVVGAHDGPGSPEVRTQLSIDAASDWNRDSLMAGVAVDNVAYTGLAAQSYTNLSGTIGGTYDIGRDTLALNYQHAALHEAPNGIGSLGITLPVPYQLDYLTASYAIRLARFSLTPQFTLASYQFGTATASGVTQGGSSNNRIVPVGTLTLAYELAPSRDLLFIVGGGGTHYVNNPTGSPSRDSTGLAVLAGLDYTADAVLRYRALFGYQIKDAASPAYRDIQAPVAEASAIWTPTSLTTVTSTISRSIEDALSGDTVSYTYTSGALKVDHEYLPNVLLRANGVLELQQQAASAVKSQTIYGGGVGVTWLLDRHATLTGSYAYTRANQTSGYSRNVGLVSLGLQL